MKTILIIDDEEYIRELLTLYLKQKGYRALTSGEGAAGLKLARKEKPDLILLDVAIPDISGMEVLKSLKTDPSLKDTPVIMLSFYELDKGANIFLRAGAAAYLVKTISLKEVVGRIEDILKAGKR